jgi:hypothetical protein
MVILESLAKIQRSMHPILFLGRLTMSCFEFATEMIVAYLAAELRERKARRSLNVCGRKILLKECHHA